MVSQHNLQLARHICLFALLRKRMVPGPGRRTYTENE